MAIRRLHAASWAVLVLGATAGTAFPGRGEDRGGAAPQENTAYVPDDDVGVRKAMALARRAEEKEDWTGVARALQTVVEGGPSAVLGVRDRGVYEGAWIVAHHEVVRLGAQSLTAYETEFGPRAREALDAAVDGHDEERIARVAETWLPTAAGRAAALFLADTSMERGDTDAALGWLERLEDLADCAGPTLSAEAGAWRKAARARWAAALAATADAVPRIEAWLAADRASPRPADADFRQPSAPEGWPTAGGGPSRSEVPPALGPSLEFQWTAPLAATPPPEADESRKGILPSPWIPPRAVVDGDRVYACDERYLYAFDAAGREAVFPPVVLAPDAPNRTSGAVGLEARNLWGWREGHGLTVHGEMAWCAVAGSPAAPSMGGDGGEEAAKPAELPHVAAVRLSGTGGDVVWRAGGTHAVSGLPDKTSLYGSPLLYRGLLWVAGTRPTTSKSQLDAWLVALDPRTGDVRHALYLGTGGPIRWGRDEEAIPGSCAGARGRVLVVTNLGIVASVDARSGRTDWLFKYDRGRPDGDNPGRRLDSEAREFGDRHSSFANEPPLLAEGIAVLAPTDSRSILSVFDRPRGLDRNLRKARPRDRVEDFRNLSLEQMVAIVPARGGRPALLVGVGQGFRAPGEIHTSVVAMDAESDTLTLVWDRALPDGSDPEPYGRALATWEEVLVPTRNGIARYRLEDGADLSFLSVSDEDAKILPPLERPFGNLVPVPGKGLLALDAGAISFWASR